MQAVNLLNAEDGGKRRCIMITNNEVSEAEEKNLIRAGYKPQDAEWQKLGVARYVNWARTVCSMKGENINGEPLQGNYLGSEIAMAEGFKSNAIFFKLEFLNKNAVRMGMSFKELLAVMWLKAGGVGKCPEVEEKPQMLILPENKFAVLFDDRFITPFEEKVSELQEIETIFVVTNSESEYKRLVKIFKEKTVLKMYESYLKHFEKNQQRNFA